MLDAWSSSEQKSSSPSSDSVAHVRIFGLWQRRRLLLRHPRLMRSLDLEEVISLLVRHGLDAPEDVLAGEELPGLGVEPQQHVSVGVPVQLTLRNPEVRLPIGPRLVGLSVENRRAVRTQDERQRREVEPVDLVDRLDVAGLLARPGVDVAETAVLPGRNQVAPEVHHDVAALRADPAVVLGLRPRDPPDDLRGLLDVPPEVDADHVHVDVPVQDVGAGVDAPAGGEVEGDEDDAERREVLHGAFSFHRDVFPYR